MNMSDEYLDVQFPDRDNLTKFPDDAYPLDAPRAPFFGIPSLGIRPSVLLAGLALGSLIGYAIFVSGCASVSTQDERNTAESRAKRAKLLHDQHVGITDATRNFDVNTKPTPKGPTPKGARP
jgi:hypothetical protein